MTNCKSKRTYLEIQDFLYDCTSRGISKNTLKQYRNTLNLIFTSIGKPIEEVTHIDIREFLNSKMEYCTKSYTNSIIKVLKVFYEFCKQEEYIVRNPMNKVKKVKEGIKVREFLNKEDIQILSNYYGKNTYLEIRNKLVVTLLIDTGVRASELCFINYEDIKPNSILINGKGNKQRIVPLSTSTLRLIRKYNKVKDVYFYQKEIPSNIILSRTGRPLDKNTVENIIRPIGKVINKKLYPHLIRHNYAVTMLKIYDIKTVSLLLGHSNIRTTEIYLQGHTIDINNKTQWKTPLSM